MRESGQERRKQDNRHMCVGTDMPLYGEGEKMSLLFIICSFVNVHTE